MQILLQLLPLLLLLQQVVSTCRYYNCFAVPVFIVVLQLPRTCRSWLNIVEIVRWTNCWESTFFFVENLDDRVWASVCVSRPRSLSAQSPPSGLIRHGVHPAMVFCCNAKGATKYNVKQWWSCCERCRRWGRYCRHCVRRQRWRHAGIRQIKVKAPKTPVSVGICQGLARRRLCQALRKAPMHGVSQVVL